MAWWLRSMLVMVATGVLAGAEAPVATPAKRALVILLDGCGFSDLSCFGSEIPTPNLDRLAQAGIRCSGFQGPGSWWYGRFGCYAGISHTRLLQNWRGGNMPAAVAERTHLIFETAQLAGVRELHIGPLHNFGGKYQGTTISNSLGPGRVDKDASGKAIYITDTSADKLIEFYSAAGSERALAVWAPALPMYPVYKSMGALTSDVDPLVATYARGGSAIAIERHARLVSLGLISATAPWSDPIGPMLAQHPEIADYRPLILTDENFDRASATAAATKSRRGLGELAASSAQGMAVYAAQLVALDRSLGRMLEAMASSHDLADTLIIVAGGSGPDSFHTHPEKPTGLGPLWTNVCSTPFLGVRGSPTAGSRRTPCILHWPTRTAPGRAGAIDPAGTCVLDLVPTLNEALGMTRVAREADGSEVPRLEGRSLLPAFSGPLPPPSVPYCCDGDGGYRMICDGRWEAISSGRGAWILFDREADPCERIDVAAAHAAEVERLSALWQSWAVSAGSKLASTTGTASGKTGNGSESKQP